MALTAKITVQNGDLLAALRDFLGSLLARDDVDAILVPQHLPVKKMVMPTLVSDPGQLAACDPLAPAFPLNGARLLARLTRKPSGGRIAALLRPCEIRAFIELVKLKQGATDNVLLLGLDCLGAYGNTDYMRWAGDDPPAATQGYYSQVLGNGGDADERLAPACRSCERPFPEAVDIALGLWGVDTTQAILAVGHSSQGEDLLKDLDLEAAAASDTRQAALADLVARRTKARDAMFSATQAATDGLLKLSGYLAACVNCYNCRVACPVCYCRECVFTTDVFDHDPLQYLRWAASKGRIKMPTDTVFYHLTRLAHMSTACVGCGQCSNACPNEIPVMDLFRTVAHRTQAAFDYQAGRSIAEAPPLTDFREDEFEEVVGM